MAAPAEESRCIHIKGAREHNLKNLDLLIPRDRFVVITGVSGSGKSSLAFDTIYAEGYRKYIDSLSTRARQILEQVKRPEVDFIEGLSPVIAIEQRTGRGANPRSTVATVTEISDYAALLWALGGESRCPQDGGAIEKRSLDDCLNRIFREGEGTRLIILAAGMTAKPAVLREELPRLRQRGFQRVRIDGEIRSLNERHLIDSKKREVRIETVIDRVVLKPDQRSRIADSLELAFQEGKDRAVILAEKREGGAEGWREIMVSRHLSCEKCGRVYDAITPKSFSYNHPDGACPACGGLGVTRQFNDLLIVPDPGKSVKKGALKPWRLGSRRMIIKRNAILKQLSEQLPFDPNVPWSDLDDGVKDRILHGAGDRLFSFKLSGGARKAEAMPFGGVVADLNETRRETTSEGLKLRLMAYQTSRMCEVCEGRRLNRESLSVFLEGKRFSEFMELTLERALALIRQIKKKGGGLEKLSDAVSGLEQRLHFLNEVGLGYLTLDRTYASLSGGEAQRVRLATQLGMGLVGVAYVLDEPTVGLHPYDNAKLQRTLKNLRERGNAVIVVEHDEETIRGADHLIELGPGAGDKGGAVIFEGPPDKAISSGKSLAGRYLKGLAAIEKNASDLKPGRDWMRVRGARCHNLKNIDVAFPIGRLSCVSGVSGSGKSSLVNDIIAHAAAFRLNRAKTIPGPHGGIEGFEYFQRSVQVDQSPIGRSPRSNPATYIKLFDLLRTLFSQCPLAKVRGYRASRFSFNVRGGRCERCRGDGVIKLDMQFLADVYGECPSCLGRRYNRETLEIRFKGYNISEVLDLSVEEGLSLFRYLPKIVAKLSTLKAVGLGYIKLGQPSTTLSGGEAQRIKLSLELSKKQQGDTLYLLDEPTTGLHWVDIQNLLDLLFKLRDAGNTVIIIEHHLDVLKVADWIVDLGPGGGEKGGGLEFAGGREEFLETCHSLTAQCLRDYLEKKVKKGR